MTRKRGLYFQKKLFMILGLFLLVLFTMLSVLVGIYTYRSSMKNMDAFFKETVESCSSEIDQMIKNMDSISVQLLANSTIQDIFSKISRSDETDTYFENHLQDRTALEVECSSINITGNSVDAIYLYNASNAFFSYNTKRYDKQQVLDFFRSDFLQEYTDYQGGYYKVIGPHKDHWIGGTETEVISLVRPLIATYSSNNKIGTIEVQYTCTRLKKVCEEKHNANRIRMLIMDDETGAFVYSADQKGNFAPSEYGQVQLIKDKTDKRYAVCRIRLGMCNWSVIGVLEYGEYMQSTRTILFLIAILCIGFCILTLLGIFLVTSRMTKPIRELRESLADITLDNVDIVSNYEGNDEIRLLQERFQQVLNALQQSAQQITLSQSAEYQAKIDVLQAQINPHFLYNSLMTISAAGQERDALKVQNMCSMLSDIFRYASSGGEETSLETEMDNVENYLNFMKFRYMENLDFTIERCQKAEKNAVPKLLLQPIIENCFQHGFRMIKPPYSIHLKCWTEKEKWLIEVEDNGHGFREESLEKIELLKKEIDFIFSDKGYGIKVDTKNLALLNVYARLKVKYGEDMEFYIKNLDAKGALVRIGGRMQTDF